MPVDGQLLRKFQTLRDRLARTFRDHAAVEDARAKGRSGSRGSLLMDPLDIDPLFVRWKEIYKELVEADPELADVPAPGTLEKFANTTAYDGRGGYAVTTVQRWERDMDEAWTLVTHPSKQLAQVSLDREGIFLAGQPFDAMMAITSIIREAKTSIVLIDGYIGERTLQLLSVKAPDVNAQILTGTLKPAVLAHAQAFVLQYGKTLEIRTSGAFHDRFVVVDDALFFHFGTSIKDAAIKNSFMFSRIEEEFVIASLRGAFASAWAAATTIEL